MEKTIFYYYKIKEKLIKEIYLFLKINILIGEKKNFKIFKNPGFFFFNISGLYNN